MSTSVFLCLRSSQRIGAVISVGASVRRRHLIEQRLEDVMIRAIDDRDVGERVAKCARGVESAESRADDEHAW